MQRKGWTGKVQGMADAGTLEKLTEMKRLAGELAEEVVALRELCGRAADYIANDLTVFSKEPEQARKLAAELEEAAQGTP